MIVDALEADMEGYLESAKEARGNANREDVKTFTEAAERIGALIAKQGKGWRGLTAAGVIEVVSGKGRAPVFQHADKAARRHRIMHDIVNRHGQTHARLGSLLHHARPAKGQLPFNADIHHPSVFLEFPCIKPAAAGPAQVDAIVLGQILRALRHGVLREIIGRSDTGHAQRRPDPHRDHVAGNRLAKADARIETLLDNIDKAVVDADLDVDVGIERQDALQGGPEQRSG
ncbi:hypothetical protein E4T56_gene19971, partial [Termitomyces sp. T112]